MARFRLKPPKPEQPGLSRPILAVKFAGESQGYATFNNGSYEFEISEELYDRIKCDEVRVTFDMQGDYPVAVLVEEIPKG